MDFKKLIFVSGKGGVGKTSLALRLSKQLGERGRRVLFVELGPTSSAKALLSLEATPHYQPTPCGLGFDWSLMQGLECLADYIGYFVKLQKVASSFLNSTLIREMVNVAPGLKDLAILGKLTSGLRNHGPSLDYDHVVVDAYSTGSFTSLLSAPSTLGAIVKKGPLYSQSSSIERTLKDQKQVQYFLVSLFEELTVDELQETLLQLGENFKDQISVVMNKYIPLEEPKLPDPDWQSFLRQRLNDQKKQEARVLKLFQNTLFMDRYTSPLEHEIKKKQGEFLRIPFSR